MKPRRAIMPVVVQSPDLMHWRRGLLGRLALNQRSLDEIESITAHLHAMLNTRLGEARALPSYGMIEFVDIVHRFPAAVQVLTHGILSLIQQFEPRLQGVFVRPLDDADEYCPAFEISGKVVIDGVHRGAVRFHTVLTASGQMRVERSY